MKHELLDNDAFVTLEKYGMWYQVQLRGPDGEVADKCRCDDYEDALSIFDDFCEKGKKL